MIYIIFLPFILSFFIVVYLSYYDHKLGNLVSEYKAELEKQGRVKGFWEWRDYWREKRPKGLLFNIKNVQHMIKNLSSEDDTEEIKNILGKMSQVTIKYQKGYILLGIIITMSMTAVIINNILLK